MIEIDKLTKHFGPIQAVDNGGTSGTLDQNNNVSNDQFKVDGGSPQTFDSSVTFDTITLTYTDGTTATVSAIFFHPNPKAPKICAGLWSSPRTSPSDGRWRTVSVRARRWRHSGCWPVASRTTSTTC